MSVRNELSTASASIMKDCWGEWVTELLHADWRMHSVFWRRTEYCRVDCISGQCI